MTIREEFPIKTNIFTPAHKGCSGARTGMYQHHDGNIGGYQNHLPTQKLCCKVDKTAVGWLHDKSACGYRRCSCVRASHYDCSILEDCRHCAGGQDALVMEAHSFRFYYKQCRQGSAFHGGIVSHCHWSDSGPQWCEC